MSEDVLRAVRERLARGWSQGAPARDASGRPVAFWGDGACSWSLSAAFALAATDGLPEGYVPNSIRAFADVTGALSLEAWNDAPDRTKEELLAAIDAALELVSSAES